MPIILIVLAFLCVFVGLPILGYELSYRLSQHYMPRYEQVRRETYEESRAYQEGMVRDLENLRLAYLQAQSPDQKAALRSTIQHRFADLPADIEMPPDLQAFKDAMENPQ